VNYIRGDMKFDSLEDLKGQIALDKLAAIKLLAGNS